nr:MAG TPA: hypothetical protein [Caudoviricetes sp.]
MQLLYRIEILIIIIKKSNKAYYYSPRWQYE